MTKQQSASWAETIGTGYAHIQHGIDRLIGWGFRKMREADRPAKEPAGRIVNAGKGIIGFLGRAGDAYFETYDRLKRKDPPAV